MKSICDGPCKAYIRIYGIVDLSEEERRGGDKTKHLCSDCFVQHKKSGDEARAKRREQREQRERRFMGNKGGNSKWKA
jgi:hypothetical protein